MASELTGYRTGDFRLEIAKGTVPGHTCIHKFGEAGDIDIADNFATVWDGATGTIAGFTKTTSYTYSTSVDIDSVVSSSAADTTDLEVQGLDANWDLTVQTVTLNGQTRVALNPALIRTFRMKNAGAAAYAGNVFCYVDGDLTAGVPNTEADVRAIIQIGNDQTLMAVFTIPNAVTGYLTDWFASISKQKDQISDIELRMRPSGGVFQIKHHSLVGAAGTSQIHYNFDVPEVAVAQTDVEMRADSSKDNGAIAAGFAVICVEN